MPATTHLGVVNVHNPRAEDITHTTYQVAAPEGAFPMQAALAVGGVQVLVGGRHSTVDSLRAEAYAMLKLSREADVLAEWLTVLAETHAGNGDTRAAVGT